MTQSNHPMPPDEIIRAEAIVQKWRDAMEQLRLQMLHEPNYDASEDAFERRYDFLTKMLDQSEEELVRVRAKYGILGKGR